jgi:hypothetical protein
MEPKEMNPPMSTYSVSELIQRWKNGKIDMPQAIGHILQHLELVTRQQSDCTSSIATLRAGLEEVANRVAGQTEQRDQPPAPRRRRRQQ